MDLSFSPEYEAFLSEVRAFLEASWGDKRQPMAEGALHTEDPQRRMSLGAGIFGAWLGK